MFTAIRGLFEPENLVERVLGNPDSEERNRIIQMAFTVAAIASVVPSLLGIGFSIFIGGLLGALLLTAGNLAHNLVILYVMLNFSVPIAHSLFEWLKIETPEGWAEDFGAVLPYIVASASLMMLIAIVPVIGPFASLAIFAYLSIKWWCVLRETLGWNTNMIISLALALLFVQVVIGAVIQAAFGIVSWCLLFLVY